MMGKKVSAYLSDPVLAALDLEADGTESLSGRAGFLICAAAEAAAGNAPEFTVSEWCAIADANNGTIWSYEHGVGSVLSGLAHNVWDSDTSQFDVDNEALARKMAKLPQVQQLAMFEIVRKFWLHSGETECKTYREVFSALGARFPD